MEQYVFINTRVLSGNSTAVLYRNEKPKEDWNDRFVVTVFSGKPEGISYPFRFRAVAVKWREALRFRKQ